MLITEGTVVEAAQTLAGKVNPMRTDIGGEVGLGVKQQLGAMRFAQRQCLASKHLVGPCFESLGP